MRRGLMERKNESRNGSLAKRSIVKKKNKKEIIITGRN